VAEAEQLSGSVETFALEAKAGDPQAIDRLWSAVKPSVVRWVGAGVRDEDAAQDVIQGVLIQVWRRLVTFRGESRFTSWLYAVTRNQIRMARRSEERHRRRRVEVSQNDLASPCPETDYLDGMTDDKLVERVDRKLSEWDRCQRYNFASLTENARRVLP